MIIKNTLIKPSLFLVINYLEILLNAAFLTFDMTSLIYKRKDWFRTCCHWTELKADHD